MSTSAYEGLPNQEFRLGTREKDKLPSIIPNLKTADLSGIKCATNLLEDTDLNT